MSDIFTIGSTSLTTTGYLYVPVNFYLLLTAFLAGLIVAHLAEAMISVRQNAEQIKINANQIRINDAQRKINDSFWRL